MDCEFFKSADAKVGGTFDPDTGNFVGGVSLNAAWDGSLSLSGITFCGGNTLTVIPVGTPIIIGSGAPVIQRSIVSPYTMSSVYGEDTLINRVFVVAKDTLITGGAATIPIVPVYLCKKNASGIVTGLSTATVPNTWGIIAMCTHVLPANII